MVKLIFSMMLIYISSIYSKFDSYHIDYQNKEIKSCFTNYKIGARKKSNHRKEITTLNAHPLAIFYDSLLNGYKDKKLKIAVVRDFYDSSDLIWHEYFLNAEVDVINIAEDQNHIFALQNTNRLFDLVIVNLSDKNADHRYFIEIFFQLLRPGGLLILEDISSNVSEDQLIETLKLSLSQLEDLKFFILSNNSIHRSSKIFVRLMMIEKAGEKPIFKNTKKMTIITPSMRPENFKKIKESLNFEFIDEWIIVYDAKKLPHNPMQFDHPKIKEYLHTSAGISGNPQRNFGLDQVQSTDTLLYFLDDDNQIHPDLYNFLDIAGNDTIYTFNQLRNAEGQLLKGNRLKLGFIDTAQAIFDYKSCQDVRWNISLYEADFYYIRDCIIKNKRNWVFVDKIMSTYNVLAR